MDLKMLHIQMYLRSHVILHKTTIEKMRYMRLLEYMLTKYENQDQWKKAVLDLYRSKLILDLPVYKEYQKKKLAKYYSMKSWLLTDCLFIGALLKKSEGNKILSNIKMFYKGSNFEFEYLFKAFYSQRELAGFKEKYPHMVNAYQIIRNNRKFIKKPEKRILFTGLMSSGKSTLLNALIGKNLNKTQCSNCTAKVHYLFDKAGEDGFNFKLDYDLNLDVSANNMNTDDINNNNNEIFKSTKFYTIPAFNQRMCFIDTPGVNSFEDPTKKCLVEKIVRSGKFDSIVYIINACVLDRVEEIEYLTLLKKIYHGKILFLLNQMDEYIRSGKAVEAIEQTKLTLKRVGFNNVEVFPISAYCAYLIKQKIQGCYLEEQEISDLDTWLRRSRRSENQLDRYYRFLHTCLSRNQKEDNLLYKALIHTGIISLENYLQQEGK